MKRKLAAALLILLYAPAGVGAQSSACARDATGALACGVQRPPAAGGTLLPTRPIPRPNLTADAAARSQAMIASRREALERQSREADEQRIRDRRECLGRADRDERQAARCGL